MPAIRNGVCATRYDEGVAKKQGTRSIVVGDERYAWRGTWAYDIDGVRIVRLAAWMDGARGMPLEAHFLGGDFVLPSDVARTIAFARQAGWDPQARGAPWIVHPDLDLKLPSGCSLTRPAPVERWAPTGAVFVAILMGGSGHHIAELLDVPKVPRSPREWQSPALLVRDGERTTVYTRAFSDLVRVLRASDSRVQYADGLFVRSQRVHLDLGADDARRIAGAEPFPDARCVGERVWLHGDGDDARIDCVTLQPSSAPAMAWRWLTTTKAEVLDRRATNP